MTADTYPSYDGFWLDYLRAHSKAATRAVHYAGTALAFLFAAAFLASFDPQYAAATVITPYAFAWGSHFLIQGNNPVSFKHPIWSLISGIRMFFLWLSQRLGGELARAGISA